MESSRYTHTNRVMHTQSVTSHLHLEGKKKKRLSQAADSSIFRASSLLLFISLVLSLTLTCRFLFLLFSFLSFWLLKTYTQAHRQIDTHTRTHTLSEIILVYSVGRFQQARCSLKKPTKHQTSTNFINIHMQTHTHTFLCKTHWIL